MLPDDASRELTETPRRWQWSPRAVILTMSGSAIMLVCAGVAPRTGPFAIIVGGVLGYYVAKPSGSVFAAWACGSTGGAILGALAGIVMLCVKPNESFVAVVVVGGILGGVGVGGLVAGAIAWITEFVKGPPPDVPDISPSFVLRFYLYGHILATAYVTAAAYGDFHGLGFPRGFLAQAALLVLLLLSLGFVPAPFVMTLTAMRYRLPVARWGPMVVAGFVLMLIQLRWLLFLC